MWSAGLYLERLFFFKSHFLNSLLLYYTKVSVCNRSETLFKVGGEMSFTADSSEGTTLGGFLGGAEEPSCQ